MVECRTCLAPKPTAEFRAGRPSCRDCEREACRLYGRSNRHKRNARLRAWRKNNPKAAAAKDRRARLRRHYGFSVDQAEQLLASNSGKCWICNDQASACIDHDHATGKVRGALCLSYNTFLGRIEANPKILPGVSAYLNRACHADVLLEIANK